MSSLVSIVVPAYNEAEALPYLVEKVRSVIEPFVTEFEIVIVNDGSSDNTESVLQALSEQHREVLPINLARNFGKESALAAGLAAARGDCLIFIDADLQHPPDTIPQMLEAWRKGADVVHAVKRRRADESAGYRASAKLFNWIMTHTIGQNMEGASDFKLIDRQVADVLLDCPERKRFFRGLVTWVGFRVANIEFDVQDRVVGETKWSLPGLIRYSLNNIFAFSSLPLRMVGYTGFFVALAGFLLLMQTMLRYVMGTAAIGFTTVIAVQILLGGMILLGLGVIAVYLSNIYDEQKARPIFIVRKQRAEFNLESERSTSHADRVGR